MAGPASATSSGSAATGAASSGARNVISCIVRVAAGLRDGVVGRDSQTGAREQPEQDGIAVWPQPPAGARPVAAASPDFRR